MYPPGLDPNPDGFDTRDALQAPRVVMIGLSGPPSAGKSTLANGLITELKSPIGPIEVNSFRTATQRRRKASAFNSETPESINFGMLCDDLDVQKEALLFYNKVANKRNPDPIFVVVEGSLLFYNKKVCERLDVHLWVHEDRETCFTNAICKNISDGANTPPDFTNVFCDLVWKAYQQNCRKQLENVPGVVELPGGLAAKQLLESAKCSITSMLVR